MANFATLTEMKKKELEKIVDDTLRQLSIIINKPQPNLAEIGTKVNNLLLSLKKEISDKLDELKTIQPELSVEDQTADDLVFRKNFDYGESIYSRLGDK